MSSACEDEDRRNWDDLNSTVSKATCMTLIEAYLGYQPRFVKGRLGYIMRGSREYCGPEDVQKKVRERILSEQNKNFKLIYNFSSHSLSNVTYIIVFPIFMAGCK